MELVIDKYKNEYDGFIRISDDVYAIKPFILNDIKTIYYNTDKIRVYPSEK